MTRYTDNAFKHMVIKLGRLRWNAGRYDLVITIGGRAAGKKQNMWLDLRRDLCQELKNVKGFKN